MKITITDSSDLTWTLAGHGAGAWSGSDSDKDWDAPSEVRVLAETTVQESKPVASARRRLYNRLNLGGTLSFTVRPKYSTLAAAAEGAVALAKRAGLTGELEVIPSPEATAGNKWSFSGTAIVQKVETRQIGVTVEAKYEIAF